MNNEQETKLAYFKSEVEKIAKNENKYMFYVVDTKGVPSGMLEYIYTIALALENAGKNVLMMHDEKEESFVGVKDWLGEKYAKLKHYSTTKQDLKVGAADILFIPEIFVNVMEGTQEMPCKRVIISQNPFFMCQLMPLGKQIGDYRLMDVLTNTQQNADLLKKWFGYAKIKTLVPTIKECFVPIDQPKKILINIVAPEDDAKKIIKTFYWAYPEFKWVTFRNIGGILQEDFANALKEAAITIWCDEYTRFGYTALEAMACGSVVIGKVTEDAPVWVQKDKGDGIIWFRTYSELCDVVMNVVRGWTHDSLPEELFDNMKETVQPYLPASAGGRDFDAEAVAVCTKYVDDRRTDLSNAINQMEKNG